MSLTIELTKDLPDDADLVVEAVITSALESVDPAVAAASGFKAELGQTVLLPGRLLVGVGPEAQLDASVVRRVSAIVARAATRVEHIAVPAPPPGQHQALAEGLALGAYSFRTYKSGDGPRLQRITVAGGGGARARAALDAGLRTAEAVNVARDLVNEPGGTLTAAVFAERAVALAEGGAFTVDVLDDKAIRKRGFTGLLAVNRGSTQPARFLELTYEPATAARATVALVGKGVTFDSGGLSLKSAEGMTWMKGDMGGAAAVLAAVSACGDLGVKVRVRGFVPLTDNMPGGDAQRVGDIIRYANGKTVEVLNTDAEGRLILADALIAASAERPAAIVDLATLTGACVVALGGKVAGLMSDHDGWAAQVHAAADAAGERVWRLPLVDEYRKDLDSKIADLKNITGGRYGGAITAALFLREFVGEGIPWAHLDIAGPAFNEGSEDGTEPVGGTGFAVRTLLQLLKSYKKP
ncbi:MAG: leucyl aminopeptidase [Acidimicrobiales bacterium]